MKNSEEFDWSVTAVTALEIGCTCQKEFQVRAKSLLGAAFLAVVAVAPAFVIPSSMPPSVQYFIGGTSVLIVVGVALDLVDKLSAQLVMRNFEGQMKESGPGWTKQGEES